MAMMLIELAAEYLFTTVLYLTSYVVFQIKDKVDLLGLLMVLAVQSGFFLLRKRANNLIAFLFGVLALTGGMVGLTMGGINQPVVIVVTIVFAIYSIVVRCVPSFRDYSTPHILLLGIMVVFYIGVELTGNQTIKAPIFWCTFCYVLLFMYASVTTNMELFLMGRKKTTIMDEGQIKRANRKVIITYVGMAGTGMLFLTLFSYQGIYDLIYQGIKFLFSLLPRGNGKEEVVEQSLEPQATFFMMQQEPKKEWPWMKYLEKLMYIVALAVIIALVIGFFYTIFRALYRGFYKRMELNTEELEQTEEIRETIQRKQKKRKPFWVSGNARGKVRTIYKKQMEGFWKESAVNRQATTPEEQRKLKDRSIHPDVVTIYEKARYSEQEILKEEAVRLKRLLREHK